MSLMLKGKASRPANKQKNKLKRMKIMKRIDKFVIRSKQVENEKKKAQKRGDIAKTVFASLLSNLIIYISSLVLKMQVLMILIPDIVCITIPPEFIYIALMILVLYMVYYWLF